MGRAPCCDKMGVKKGPWTTEEDRILADFIHRNGHGNWRALPKQAGLLRCGKSCRLRWINYLRPDIKRGNFSYEEEEAIIKLHQLLGNRWSTIASRLPGRTDNEIKNVWNTHLKKRLLRMGTDPVKSAVATDSRLPMISLDYSECSEASPSMKKDMLVHIPALTQPQVSFDYPTTNLSSSDDLSSEIFSSTDNEATNSGSTLDCIQFDCNDSFDVELEYQQYPITTEEHPKCQDLVLDETFIMENQSFGDEEKSLPRQSSEDLYFMSSYAENDMLNSIDGANTNTLLLWNEEFQFYDDDCDSMGYWLRVLTQAEPLPTL
ncbi:hypothetical protein SUGI_1067980 [Cryptomeria japonica]|uniref:transcription factor MYB30 n=1 Tax=Cryptomeria japonica TaxID=3369 RepID=UPI002414BE25|nr:transcription factor MYB30 [Cryptomeria japonica]GLJ50188.1 hypothetical protein SUGI_1067980 [Cryptomeria japonica]